MTDAVRSLFELLTKKEKSGSDYTGTVTRVDGKTAYVRFSGAEIADTPVSMSIGAKAGDSVRIRVADGRAWIVGNDTAPPNDSSEVAYGLVQTNALIDTIMTERIKGENGWINLLLGTFNYGNGALAWNGETLSVKGKVETENGKIGGWDIGTSSIYSGTIGANSAKITLTSGTAANITVQSSNWTTTIDDEGVTSFAHPIISGVQNDYVNRLIAQGIDCTLSINDGGSYTYQTSIRPDSLSLLRREPGVADKTVDLYNGEGHFSGDVYAAKFREGGTLLSNKYAPISSSDIRLKENIADSTADALSVIDAIRIRQFDWKDEARGHWDCGMVADEMENIDPKFRIGGEGDEEGSPSYKAVNTFYLQGYEIKAIQELHARVKSLESEVAELKQMILEMRKGTL